MQVRARLVAFALGCVLVAAACSERPPDLPQVFPEGLVDPTEGGAPLPDGYRTSFDRDELRPIYDPEFTGAGDAPWRDSDLVIGVELGGEPRAYPIGLLAWSEIVVDEHAGVPTLVTWCPLCGTGLVHRREVDGEAVLFGNQGDLFDGAMTWFDHGTGSVWSQPTGTAILGPLAGRRLELLPSAVTTWGDWRRLHPDTRALDTHTVASSFFLSQTHVVVVVEGDSAAVAVRDLRRVGSVSAEVGGGPVVFVAAPDTELTSVFSTSLDGGAGIVRLAGGLLVDEVGRRWDPGSGVSLDGGTDLERLPTLSVFAEDFPAHFPDGRFIEIE